MKLAKDLGHSLMVISKYDSSSKFIVDATTKELVVSSVVAYHTMPFTIKQDLYKKGWDFDITKGEWFLKLND